jgi:hypothetical protein
MYFIFERDALAFERKAKHFRICERERTVVNAPKYGYMYAHKVLLHVQPLLSATFFPTLYFS